jgi:hypothetical protein
VSRQRLEDRDDTIVPLDDDDEGRHGMDPESEEDFRIFEEQSHDHRQRQMRLRPHRRSIGGINGRSSQSRAF